MKYLFVMRHGETDTATNLFSETLTKWGIKMIEKTALKLGKIFEGQKVLIITSDSERAIATTNILNASLKANVIQDPVLRMFGNDLATSIKTLESVKQYADKYDVIILVTHLENVARFPNYFYNKYLGQIGEEKRENIDNSCGWLIDCVNGTKEFISTKD